jgi:hypothetical protein
LPPTPDTRRTPVLFLFGPPGVFCNHPLHQRSVDTQLG